MRDYSKKISNTNDNTLSLLLAIGLLGLMLRLILLYHSSVWYDEAISIFFAKAKLTALIDFLKVDRGEPFYYILLKYWIRLFGDGEKACASFSTLLSVANIFSIYFLAKYIFNKKIGLISAFLLAVNVLELHNATNIRFYSLLNTLTILSYYSFFRMIKENRFVWLYISISILGFYTHTYYGFVFLAQLMIVIIFYKDRFKNVIMPFCCIVGFYVPWLLTAWLDQLRNMLFFGTDLPKISGGIVGAFVVFGKSIFWKIIPILRLSFYGSILVLVCLVFFALFAISIKINKGRVSQNIYTLSVLIVSYIFLVGAPIFISTIKPIYLITRYDIIGLAPLLICVAFLIEKLYTLKAQIFYITLIIMFLLCIPNLRYKICDKLDGDRATVMQLKDILTEKDVVIYTARSYYAAEYYFQQLKIPSKYRYFFPKTLTQYPLITHETYYADKEDELRKEARALADLLVRDDIGRIVLFYSDQPEGMTLDPGHQIVEYVKAALDEHFFIEHEIKVPAHAWGPLYNRVLIYNKRHM